MTGATGDLTPDEIQADFEPGEWREASGAERQADVTLSQAAQAPAQSGDTGAPGQPAFEGGPTELAGRESGYGSDRGLDPNDPAYRMEVRPVVPRPEDDSADRGPRIGGDELHDHDEHL